jgi:tryptophan synthase alpha chain
LILPDVPYIERERFAEELDRRKLALVNFITPESSDDDIRQRSANANGFVYAVSMRGTTGRRSKLKMIPRARFQWPVTCAGCRGNRFWYQYRRSGPAALEFSDGCIIGTRAVQALEGGLDILNVLLTN